MPPPQADAAAAPSLSGAARAIGWLAAIVAILLLGSLFWSALGAFASSWRDARAALPVLNSRATATRVLAPSTLVPVASGSTEGPRTTASPALLGPPELTDATPLPTNATATRAPQLSATPTPVPSPTADTTPTAVPTAPSGRL